MVGEEKISSIVSPSLSEQDESQFKLNEHRSTVWRRQNGITGSKHEGYERQRLLKDQDTKTLVEHINRLTLQGLPPTKAMVRNFIGELSSTPPGKNYVQKFLKRNSDRLASAYLRPFDIKRKRADNPAWIEPFYDRLEEKIEKYDIQPHNTYNMDEKGFLPGILTMMERIFTKELWENGFLKGAGTDGNREWITVLAAICADGSWVPPALIYPAKNEAIMDSWLQDFDPEHDKCYFTSTETGWTNDQVAIEWVEKVFDRETKAKARNGRDWRLLILDGHGSHVTLGFIEYCIKRRILVDVLPPHTTHRTQPLDRSLFGPLQSNYTTELNKHMHQTQGLSALTKRDFFKLFYTAWVKTFTEKNILSGFKHCGIYPLDKSVVLDSFKTPPPKQLPRPQSSSSTHSKLSLKDKRRIRQLVNSEVSTATPDGRLLKNTVLHLLDTALLLRDEVSDLRSTILAEKKKGKRGKNLTELLRAEDEHNQLFFSPSKVVRARGLYQQKEDEKQAEIDRKAAEKLERQQKKDNEEAAKQLRKETRENNKRLREAEAARKALVREEEKQARQLKAQLQNDAQLTKKTPKKRLVKRTTTRQEIIEDYEVVESEEGVAGPSRPRRQRRRPGYLKDFEIYEDL